MSIFIVGAGIVTEKISNINDLMSGGMEKIDPVLPLKNSAEYINKHWDFHSKSMVSREDRSLLNNISKLSIDVSAQAMEMAQIHNKYGDDQKNEFAIFSATEAIEHELSSLDGLLEECHYDAGVALYKLGNLKKYLNPSDMLRLLSTNVVYHLSKIFGLRGGGYPLRRMSLGGLCALEVAYRFGRIDLSRSLVIGLGNICDVENMCAFMKMGLVRTLDNDNGIIPSYGSAALVIESGSYDCRENELIAEIVNVVSVYSNNKFASRDDWLCLFDNVCIGDGNLLNIICYDNGVRQLFEEEQYAIKKKFPGANCFSYKSRVGYTGKANNLIDLVLSLSDDRIPINSYVLINGMGTGTGVGCILIKKLRNLNYGR